MNIYYNAEYTGPNQHSHLISMGFVAETGQRLYLEFYDVPTYLLSDYDINEVLPETSFYGGTSKIPKYEFDAHGVDYAVVNISSAPTLIEHWMSELERADDEKLQLVTYCGHYDAVLFYNLFSKVPPYISRIPYDVTSHLADSLSEDISLSEKMDKVLSDIAQITKGFGKYSEDVGFLTDNALKYAEMIKYLYHHK